MLIEDHGKIKWLGGTRDDAAGECFDKTARVLGLGYPGGPEIAAAAAKFKNQSARRRTKSQMKLPRPMINDKNYDFSFSGLKTAVLRQGLRLSSAERPQDKLSKEKRAMLSYEIQEAITDVLVAKTIRAAREFQVKSILLSGGVAANSRLREKFKLSIRHTPFAIYQPPPRLCTDNATYIAACAYFNPKSIPWQKVKVDPGLRIC